VNAKLRKSIQHQARKMVALKATANALYEKADKCLAKLIEHCKPGDTFEIDGQTYGLVDNFATSNKAWKAAGISRYDFKKLSRADLDRKNAAAAPTSPPPS